MLEAENRKLDAEKKMIERRHEDERKNKIRKIYKFASLQS